MLAASRTLACATILFSTSIAFSQVRGVDLLGGYARALNSAQSLKAKYSLTRIGGTTTEHELEAQKPNRFRINSGTLNVLADGKDIFVLDRSSLIFYRLPATEEYIKPILETAQAEVFSPFFRQDAYAKVVNPRATGTVRRKGLELEGVSFSPLNDAKKFLVTYYMPRTDSLVRQAELLRTDQGKQTSVVLDTKSISTTEEIPASRFVWTAPENSLELPYELATGKAWFTDMELAKDVARRTKKILFLNFHSGTCRGCQVLKEGVFTRPDIMALSRNFVLCEIDIDKQAALAKSYDANSHPVFKFYRHDGTLLEDQRGDFGLDAMLRIFQAVLASER